MFDVGWQVWIALILVGVVVYFILDAATNPNGIDKLIARLWKRLVEVPEFSASDDLRAETASRLRSQYPAFADDGVAGVLLTQAQALARSEAAGVRSLEARAVALIGLVSAGIVLLTFFAQRDPLGSFGASFGFALFLFFLSIVANAICSWPVRHTSPSFEAYHSVEASQSNEVKAPIIFELTEAVLAYYRKLYVAGIKKGRWQALGTILLIAGVFLLLLNYYFSASHRPGAPGGPPHFNNCPPGNPVLCNRLDT